MNYLIEYELPRGTHGAYFAPIKKGAVEFGDYAGQPYAYEMEFLLNENKVEILEMGKRTVTGALGEELQVIKLRIVR